MTNVPNQRGETYGDERRRTPTAEPREPQINRTICGCQCGVRGCIQGDQGKDGSEPDGGAHTEFLAGDEGVNNEPLDTNTQKPSPSVQYTINSILSPRNANHEHGCHTFDNGSTFLAHDLPFHSLRSIERINSDDSLYMQLSSGEMSMASSVSVPRSSRSHEDLVSIGSWIPVYVYQEEHETDAEDEESPR